MRILAIIGIFFGVFSFPEKDWSGEVFVDKNDGYHLTTPQEALQNGWLRPKRGYIFGNRIDFATIDKESLCDLPGIGPSLAKKLLQLHKENPYPKWDDIDSISGIGPAKLQLLKSHIVLKKQLP